MLLLLGGGVGCRWVCTITFAKDLSFEYFPCVYKTNGDNDAYSLLLIFLRTVEILHVNELRVMANFL